MKYRIDTIYPGSAFRLFFFTTLIIGGCFGLVFLLISPFIGMLLWGALVFVVGVPLTAFAVASVVSFETWLYSYFSKKFGGINIDLILDEEKE